MDFQRYSFPESEVLWRFRPLSEVSLRKFKVNIDLGEHDYGSTLIA